MTDHADMATWDTGLMDVWDKSDTTIRIMISTATDNITDNKIYRVTRIRTGNSTNKVTRNIVGNAIFNNIK